MSEITKTIKVEYLARVEGEGALHLKIRGGKVEEASFKIFEPPRFFEALLRGRPLEEAPDITARICGICPVAYQMSAVQAMENALGVTLPDHLHQLRRLLYCGEWIESHVLHISMLHAPDFHQVHSVVELAKLAPDVVKDALALKKAGNAIVSTLGGREIHPINVKVGGFYSLPTKQAWDSLHGQLTLALPLAKKLLQWVSTFEFPVLKQDYTFVAMDHPSQYPLYYRPTISAGVALKSNRGHRLHASEFLDYFEEQHVERSNALHCILKNQGNYFVGPLARLSLHFDLLPPLLQKLALQSGWTPQSAHNPFYSIIARAVEVIYAVSTALEIIESVIFNSTIGELESEVSWQPRAGVGHGITEAPRGLLYHRYEVDDAGLIVNARIIPPTSQNQLTIEQDLKLFVEAHLHLSDEELKWRCEQAIRNYDPCISCATHFLKLTIDRDLKHVGRSS